MSEAEQKMFLSKIWVGWRQMAKAVVKKARPERSLMHFVSFFRAASFLDAIPSLTLTDSMSHKDCNNIFCVQKLTYDEASKTTLFSWNLSLSTELIFGATGATGGRVKFLSVV